MLNERGFNYFDAYVKQIEFAFELACNLENAVSVGDFGSRDLMNALHTIENDADAVTHKIQHHLLLDFSVPFERNSMVALANALDDISDAVENIAIKAYYYHCDHIEKEGYEMITLVVKALQSLKSAVDLLPFHSKQYEQIKFYLIQAQDIESKCDNLYIEAVRELYGQADLHPEQRHIARSILSAVECASDAVEKAAEQVESIVVESA
ncbi:MAG: DUF47 domain-containing protein [Anaerotardibacter sp.]